MKKTLRNKKTTPQLYFDSQSAAAAHLGVKARQIRLAKKLGAPGFRSGRIYAEELAPWLKQHAARLIDAKEELECNLLRLQCERIEFANRQEREKYVNLAAFIAYMKELAKGAEKVFERKLVREMPDAIPNLSPEQRLFVRDFNQELKKRLCAEFARFQKQLEDMKK